MIRQKFKIEKYDWQVYAFYDADQYCNDEITERLEELHLPKDYVRSAYSILDTGKRNYGITLTNSKERTSAIIITRTTNASQFVNSFSHEIYHLTNHIARVSGIDFNSEEICYLSGYISQQMFSSCRRLMCDCCRHES